MDWENIVITPSRSLKSAGNFVAVSVECPAELKDSGEVADTGTEGHGWLRVLLLYFYGC